MTLPKLDRLHFAEDLGALWELAFHILVNELKVVANRGLARLCEELGLVNLPLSVQRLVLRVDILADSKLVLASTAPNIHVATLVKGCRVVRSGGYAGDRLVELGRLRRLELDLLRLKALHRAAVCADAQLPLQAVSEGKDLPSFV